MWCSYKKTFVYRDCFDKEMNENTTKAINKLLDTKQADGSSGCYVTTEFLSVSKITNKIETYESEDDGALNIKFLSKEDVEVANICLWNHKEVHLCFEIEEQLETGEITIHYCFVEGFEEHQI